MERIVIFAANHYQFHEFIMNHKLPRHEVVYATQVADLLARDLNVPIIILEGFEYNPYYTVGFISVLNRKFRNFYFACSHEVYKWEDL